MNSNENNPLNEDQGNFGMPGDYFQRSANSIFNRIGWEEEHKQFPLLLKYKTDPGFTIPENYFNINEQRLELLDVPHLGAFDKHTVFTVPGNYFEEAEITLFAQEKISEAQEQEAFHILDAIPKHRSFQTPVKYFTESSERLTTLLEVKKQIRVVRLFSSKTWYAAAAVLVVAFGMWTYSRYARPAAEQDCGTIACIDKADLVKTKTLENLESEDLYELVNSKQLEEHLNSGATKNDVKLTPDSSTRNDALDDLPDGI